MIHYISPYRSDKNIGKAINDAVEQIAAYPRDCQDDWIIHTDHDTLWLLPDSKAQVERILAGTVYDVLSCMTNRITSAEQLVNGYFNENDRIRDHIGIARHCRTNAGDLVVAARGPMAAFMLCFRVSMWHQAGGFAEGVLNFDSMFCRQVLAVGGKIGLMQGVYVWHSYRLTSANARRDARHLI